MPTLGYDAGESVTTGGENVFVGNISGQFLTAGNFDTFVGQHSGGYIVSDSSVTTVGNDSMRNAVGVAGSDAFGKSDKAFGSSPNSTAIGGGTLEGQFRLYLCNRHRYAQ